jgi:hypothetical protein
MASNEKYFGYSFIPENYEDLSYETKIKYRQEAWDMLLGVIRDYPNKKVSKA